MFSCAGVSGLSCARIIDMSLIGLRAGCPYPLAPSAAGSSSWVGLIWPLRAPILAAQDLHGPRHQRAPHGFGQFLRRTLPIDLLDHQQISRVHIETLRAAKVRQFAAVRVSPDNVLRYFRYLHHA